MKNDIILVLNSKQIEQKINRIAHQIYEDNFEEDAIIIAGIVKQGYVLAKRITKILKSISPIKVNLVKIVVNKKSPMDNEIQCSLSVNDYQQKVIILVDDVVNSGTTLILGTKQFLDTPVKKLTTIALVDRKHRRYPIRVDFVGISLATTLQEHITVKLGKKDAVYLK